MDVGNKTIPSITCKTQLDTKVTEKQPEKQNIEKSLINTQDVIKVTNTNVYRPTNTLIKNGVSLELFDPKIEGLNKEEEDKIEYEFLNTNGVFNSCTDAELTQKELNNLTSKEIALEYNQTHGVLDVPEAISQLLDIPLTKDLVMAINHYSSESEKHVSLNQSGLNVMKKTYKAIKGEKRVDEELADKIYSILKSGKGIKAIAHSQGAAIWGNALNIARTKLMKEADSLDDVEKLMSRVKILTIGAFADRVDFPIEVTLLKMENTIFSPKGQDLISLAGSKDASLLASKKRYMMGNPEEVTYLGAAAKRVINESPNRNSFNKAVSTSVVNGFVIGHNTLAKTERFISSLTNTAAAVMLIPLNMRLGNGNPLASHEALSGYIGQSEVVDENIKSFFGESDKDI